MKNIAKLILGYTLLTSLLTFQNCASMKTPQGGPKDKEAPKVVSEYPKNLSSHFKAKRIVITFDEYFNLKNEFKEISISPATKQNLEFKIKQKSLVIELKDTLETNTTYKISFGNEICDVNEGNILKNYNYIFSTGAYIDSLDIVGKVINAYTLKPEKEITVVLYKNVVDSIFKKESSSLYTITDSAGKFKISNLKKDLYNIYAIKDENGNRHFDSEEHLAFSDKKIEPKKNSKDSILLKLFKEKIKKVKITEKKLLNNGGLKIGFNSAMTKDKIKMLYPSDSIKHKTYLKFNKECDSLFIWIDNIVKLDSINLVVNSMYKQDSISFKRNGKSKLKAKIKLDDNLSSNEIKPGDSFIVESDIPIMKFDKSKFYLKEDTTKVKFDLEKLDEYKLSINYDWKDKKRYTFCIADSSLIGLNDLYNLEYKKEFKYGSLENYGSISLKFIASDTTKYYVVEINELSNKNTLIYKNKLIKNKNIDLKRLAVGKYVVKVAEDINQNGEWDTGDLDKKHQPEKIYYFNKIIPVKPNWDIEEKIIIPKEIIP